MGDENEFCKICRLGPLKPEDMGSFARVGNINCHANCMYFSSGLTQDVDIDNDWLGFNEQNIQRLVKQVSGKKCLYCEKNGANIVCSRKGCKRRFHFHCGLQHHVTYQFHDSFHSYCHKHRTHYKKLNQPNNGPINERCVYCFEDITGIMDRLLYFRSHCCNATYMHIQCAKIGAMNAGAFTKCPGCNADAPFIAQLLTIGVYVPHSDAAWEDDERFQDLYEPRRACVATKCICPPKHKYALGTGARMRNDKDGYWKLMLCRLCGGSEVHKGCLDAMKRYQYRYTCRTCTDVEIGLRFKKRMLKRIGKGKKVASGPPQSSRVLRNRNC